MKSLNYFELKSFLSWLEPQLMGAQLQEIWTNGEILVLELYRQKTLFLLLDLRPMFPSLAISESKPPIAKKSKPVSLFLNSHAKNLKLTEIYADRKKGRVVDFWFEGGEKKCHCEATLIPRSVNFMVESGSKKIYWEKPRELPAAQLPVEMEVDINWQEWCAQRLEQFKNLKLKKEKTGPNVEKILEKKRKALLALQESLESKEFERWQTLGELLKVTDQVPKELADLYDGRLSVKTNRQNAFEKSKSLLRKQLGTQARIKSLTEEIDKLTKFGLPELAASTSRKILQKTDSKARKLVLEPGLEALIGKSAADNLSILRQARAWDLWLHLKDYPGSHAIIFRDKNKNVSPGYIQKVAQWVISESRKFSIGAKYDVVVVECRHVRPIKGDKLGRVTYHNPQTYSFAFTSGN